MRRVSRRGARHRPGAASGRRRRGSRSARRRSGTAPGPGSDAAHVSASPGHRSWRTPATTSHPRAIGRPERVPVGLLERVPLRRRLPRAATAYRGRRRSEPSTFQSPPETSWPARLRARRTARRRGWRRHGRCGRRRRGRRRRDRVGDGRDERRQHRRCRGGGSRRGRGRRRAGASTAWGSGGGCCCCPDGPRTPRARTLSPRRRVGGSRRRVPPSRESAPSSTRTSRNMPASMWKGRWQ